jgi:glycosyltransferase involved in cell wall biosynthesis
MKSQSILILFSDAFPFDIREPHLTDEVDYLFNSFERVYIFSTHPNTHILFSLPSNVKVYSVTVSIHLINKLKSLQYIFSDIFLKEYSFVKDRLNSQFSFKKIKIFLAEFCKAQILYKTVDSKLKHEFQDKNQIYIYSFWNNYKAIAAALIKEKHPSVKAFSRAHGWDVYFERHRENYLPGKSFLLEKLDAIYYVSANGLQYSLKIFGKSPNLKLSRMGSFNNFQPKIDKTRDPFHIVSCSNLIPLKRVDLIIQALSILNDEYKISWTHIGDGSLMDSLNIRAKELLSAKKNLSFCFLGFISKKEVKEYYNNNTINLFINVSTTEGLPVSIMEAMSFSIPVIATNVGGSSEIVIDKKNGTLLNENANPEEIAKSIENYIEMDENQYFLMCNAAYSTWKEKFNAEKNYSDFIQEIFSL